MKTHNWAVTAHYAPAPGRRPPTRRHPAPEDFIQRTVVGPAHASTVEAVLDLLDVPENVRAMIRAKDDVRSFVEGRLIPDQPYPHHVVGMHYVSNAPDAQLIEWTIDFVFVTRMIVDQTTGEPT